MNAPKYKITKFLIIISIITIFLSLSLDLNSLSVDRYNLDINQGLFFSQESISEKLPRYKIQYSSYFGGGEELPYSINQEYGKAIAVDSDGCAWIVGMSPAVDFPIIGGRINSTPYGENMFLMKIAPDGSEILYSTFIIGSGLDVPTDIAVDANDDVWIIGKTWSSDFPTTPNALNPTPTNASAYPEVYDGFICRISGTDGSLEYSSYIGGDNVLPLSISISNLGYIWVAGKTDSDRIPMTLNSIQPNYGGGPFDGFIMQYSSNGELLLFSSLYGGQGDDSITDTAMDKANLWITGRTSTFKRGGFPISGDALDDTMDGSYDAFIGQIDNSDRKFPALGYGSFLGGTEYEFGECILVDDHSKIWVIGGTSSTDFPIQDAYDSSFNGFRDLFIFGMRFTEFVPIIDNSSYFGGDDLDVVEAAGLDEDNHLWFTGSTLSTDFPIIDGYDELDLGKYNLLDAYVVRMDSTMRDVLYSTYLGGPNQDGGLGLDYDALNDRIWVTGGAQNGFPLEDAYDYEFSGDLFWGNSDIFATYFGPPMPPTPPRDLSGILSLDGKILLVWGTPEDLDDSAIEYYKVFREINNEGSVYYADSTGLAFVDEDISPNATYQYTVTAVNGVGESGHSNVFSLTIPDIENLTELLESIPETSPAQGILFTISIVGALVILRRKSKKSRKD